MHKKQKQAHVAFQKAIIGKIQATRHAVKFISQAVVCFLKMRSSNLAIIANAFESDTRTASVYKQMQRFLRSFRWRASGFEALQLELLAISGRVDLIIDRTEWKFGRVWINLLMVSVYYRGLAIPVGWKVFSVKGNGSGRQDVLVLLAVVRRLGKQHIRKIYGDREFCNREVFDYLYEEELDFCIRLKKNYLANEISFKELLVRQEIGVKLKYRRKITVPGKPPGISCARVSADEYLIVGTREVEPQLFAERQKRCGIETLFGNLKSRGFDFEETRLVKRSRIKRLMLLLSLAKLLSCT